MKGIYTDLMLPPPRHDQDERDLDRMMALLQAGRAAGISSYYVHPGDLKWWLFYPPLGASWQGHIYLWDDPAQDGRILGWGLIDPNGDTFDVFFQPELNGSAVGEAMFAWAEEAAVQVACAAGRKKTGMFWVSPGDSFRAGWLEARGYHMAYQSAALFRPLSEPIMEPSIPEGFRVRLCRGVAEVEARARAQYGAFGSSAPFEQYLQRFTGFMRSPAYAPDSDLVTVAPDGRIASFCITWKDEVNAVGLFEPVGTHPDFQRKGLGKAVMLEGLRRLQAQGMRRAILCTGENNAPALALYASVGFQQYDLVRFYEKELR